MNQQTKDMIRWVVDSEDESISWGDSFCYLSCFRLYLSLEEGRLCWEDCSSLDTSWNIRRLLLSPLSSNINPSVIQYQGTKARPILDTQTNILYGFLDYILSASSFSSLPRFCSKSKPWYSISITSTRDIIISGRERPKWDYYFSCSQLVREQVSLLTHRRETLLIEYTLMSKIIVVIIFLLQSPLRHYRRRELMESTELLLLLASLD
jgi:hypothetical protein